ncbi:putative senescence regulator S40 [Helianthus anomalus]
MAKGRKLIASRSEVLLGSYGYGGNTIQDEDEGEELGEDDVWSLVDGMVNQSDHDWSSRANVESNTRRGYRNPVPRGDGTIGGLSSALADAPSKMVSSPRIVHHFVTGDSFASPRGRHVATSAPVNVPDWSKIYRVDSVESMHDSDDVTDGQDLDMVPPHEYLARSRDSAANSVFVGSGRTLKGRDLSRVRDAVWSHTGFNG